MPPPDPAASLAITALVARYCDAVAAADEAGFAACWAPDARWTGPGLERSGVDDIVATWATMRGRFALALQGIQSGTVRVDGTTATGTWWVREVLVSHDGRRRETLGRYDDRYAYGAEGGWRMVHRHFTRAG